MEFREKRQKYRYNKFSKNKVHLFDIKYSLNL